MTIDRSVIKKILLIKLRGIGDVILSTVVLDNLKLNFPSATIDYLTEKPSEQIIENLNEVEKVIIFNQKDLKGRINLIQKVRNERYDLIFDFYTNPFTAQLTFLSGARYRAGFPYKGRKYAYNLYGPEERGKHHAAVLHLEFLKKLGLQVKSDNLKVALDAQAKSFAATFFGNTFSDDDFIVGISPSGGWASKKCDPIKFAEIADRIVDKYKAKILILWGPDDEKECDEIISIMINNVVKAPPSKIQEMAELISNCDLLLANDSGPMHISTAVGTPTLSLHGPTDPKLQGPYGEQHAWINKSDLHCIICNLLDCPYNHECFLQLDTNEVIAKFDQLIEKNNITV